MTVDFELTKEQKLMQQVAREFAFKEFTPQVAAEHERRGEFPWSLYRKCAQQGYIGMTWPLEYGGQGLSFLDSMIIMYELIKADPPLAAAVLAGNFGSDIIAEFGTHEQKAKWLPKVAKGEITTAGCFTEPAGGSDISRRLDTQAVKDGEYWVINGAKTFITNGTTATVFVTLVQTDLNVQPPYRGQTEFIVERGSGVEASAFKEKMGWFTSPTAEVRFNDVRVKDEDIVGGPENLNRGFYLGLRFLDAARCAIGVHAAATAEAALEKAISYCKERAAFGRRIGGFQGLAFRIVEMASKIEFLKVFALKASWLVDKAKEAFTRGEISVVEESVKIASMLKWYAARTAVEACDLALDVMAGYGYIESDIQRWYRFAKSLEIVEGTKEIQKNTIARLIFGKEIVKTF